MLHWGEILEYGEYRKEGSMVITQNLPKREVLGSRFSWFVSQRPKSSIDNWWDSKFLPSIPQGNPFGTTHWLQTVRADFPWVSPRKEVIWRKLEKSETRKRKTRKIKDRKWQQQINLGAILREIHLRVCNRSEFNGVKICDWIEWKKGRAVSDPAFPIYSVNAP